MAPTSSSPADAAQGQQARYDILGLGNAIVDIIARTSDAFLTDHALTKGAMALIAEEPAEHLLAAMGDTTVVSGGSAANTVIGAASLGCRAAVVGKVKARRPPAASCW